MIRVGTGFDSHRLAEGRDLVLGGVNIEYEYGLDGHSDADVLVHAIMDALLGAVAKGDIGKHFPPGDPEWKGADSMDLLRRVVEILKSCNAEIINIDSTVIAEAPRLSIFIDEMIENISQTVEIPVSRVSVKATTAEQMGALGRGEGIAAMAAVSVDVKE